MKGRFLPEGDELGLPWEQWSDGLPHRLKRKRDFGDVDPELVREAAKNAAKRMGKVVQALPDKMTVKSAEKYVWIQFADYEVRVGDPCKCGGRRLLRVHPFFARCTECGAELLLAPKKNEGFESTDDEDDEDGERPDPGGFLRDLTDVHLSRIEHFDDRETYRGYGRLGETQVFLIVQFRAGPNEQLRADDALDRVAAVQILPLRHLDGLLDTSALMDPRAAWDLTL